MDKYTKADATDSSAEQADETKKLKETDPDKFEKYKGLGTNIDVIYDEAMQRELSSGWGGMNISDGYKKYVKQDMTENDFKATVPMCIDNEFSSVENLLSE
ncbi:hypothetical protein FACS1894176_01730 [Bacteroidia bacterium]|nr:hypothetical protein FACS1894176_01730 [Bacteroidia bacterium]